MTEWNEGDIEQDDATVVPILKRTLQARTIERFSGYRVHRGQVDMLLDTLEHLEPTNSIEALWKVQGELVLRLIEFGKFWDERVSDAVMKWISHTPPRAEEYIELIKGGRNHAS